MWKYYIATLDKAPKLSDFNVPSEEQKNGERKLLDIWRSLGTPYTVSDQEAKKQDILPARASLYWMKGYQPTACRKQVVAKESATLAISSATLALAYLRPEKDRLPSLQRNKDTRI